MPKITDIEVIKFKAPKVEDSTWNDLPIAKPFSCYPECRKALNIADGATVVKITCDEGVYGLGHAGGYKYVTDSMIRDYLKPLLLGLNPLEIERLWDLMFKVTFPHSRKGVGMQAISAVDIALWDLFGKLVGQPVYQLLGGKVRDKIRVYSTGPDVERHKKEKYMGTKLPIPYGPCHGKEGMRKNEELVRHAREVWGDEGEIMLDCWSAWDQPYTIRMAHMLKDYNIKWIEEPLMPDDYEGYRRLRDILNPMGIMVTGGEHEFTRFGARELIDRGCVDIVQTDVWYCGGITELKKIIAYASAHGVMVVPHQYGLPAYHISINSVVSPFAENVIKYGEPRLFHNEPLPVDGYIELSDAPGFGYELNYDYGEIIP